MALQRLHAAEGGAVSCATLTCGAEDRELRRPEKTRSRIQTVCAECRREAKPLAEDAGEEEEEKAHRRRAVRRTTGVEGARVSGLKHGIMFTSAHETNTFVHHCGINPASPSCLV